MGRRVVISGIGPVSALGVGRSAFWGGLTEGRSGLGRIARFDASGFECPWGGEIRNFSGKDQVPKSYRKAVKMMARDIEIAVACARAAGEDARLITRSDEAGAAPSYPPARLGCQIGAGLIAAETQELTEALVTARAPDGDPAAEGFSLRVWGGLQDPAAGMANLQPLWLLKYLPNMLACHVTIIHGAEGPSNTLTCSEASGPLCVAEAARVIERGDADACFAGSAESRLNLSGLMKLQLAGRLWRGQPGQVSDEGAWTLVRPFDPAARGALAGEGGGIVVVEEEQSAKSRGARSYARVAGVGAAQSSWLRGGELLARRQGLADAIRAALEDAKVKPGQIDAVVPQAIGQADLDACEAGALSDVLGPETLARTPLITLAPFVGDTVAGQGGLQACAAALCLGEGRLPARLHAGGPAPGLDAGACESRAASLSYVLVCTGSLGGQNSALVLARN